MQNHTTIIGVLDLRAMGCTYDDCRAKYGIGNSTVRLIESRHKKTGIPLETLKGMDPSEVVALFFPNKGPSKEKPMPDYQKIYDRIHEKGSKANLFFLWMEYKGQHANGYQYTQFAEHYKRFVAERYPTKALSMAVERIPGERVYIDWAGDTPKLVLDVRTGQLLAVHLFVTAVGVSGLIYAEAFPNEQIPSFCDGTSHAMEYYGATPRFFVPDNCKTAVTKHTKDRLAINAAYRDLESFYGVVVLPPPPRKPKGKPTVEKAVQYTETWILEKLRERAPYAGFAAINDRIKKIVDELNGSIPRINSSMNLGHWNDDPRDIYEVIFHECYPDEPFTASTRTIIKGDLILRAYFEGTLEKMISDVWGQISHGPIKQNEVKEALALLDRSIRKITGPVIYGSDIFYFESCVYLEVLKCLLDDGGKAWLLYDGIYADGVMMDELFAGYVEATIKVCFKRFYDEYRRARGI